MEDLTQTMKWTNQSIEPKSATLRVALHSPALMLGDNISVLLNTTVPSSFLKKKLNAIAYHRIIRAIAARIMKFSCVKSEESVSDVMIRPVIEKFYYLMKRWFFLAPEANE
jgi:hypothetical protein